MILVADIGNSRIKWAELSNGELENNNSAPWQAAEFDATLGAHWRSLTRPDRVVAANVAGTPIDAALAAWTEQAWGIKPEMLKVQRAACGVVNGYSDITKLGVDRWIAAIGAWHQVQKAACIVDCGTAITIDAVSAQAEYLGGIIAPGMWLMRDSLTSRSPALVDDGAPAEQLLGVTTEQAIASGAKNAALGLIERVSQELKAKLGADMCRIITGGDAGPIAAYLDERWVHCPDLVLRGVVVAAGVAP